MNAYFLLSEKILKNWDTKEGAGKCIIHTVNHISDIE